jgi:glycosyltransferase involved in cell wall biosynthesis
VLTTNAGGIPDLVTDGETALVVAINDHEALARGAITLIEQPELADRLVTEASEECGRYTWEAVRNEWLNSYGASR